jgi:hypothetical protein
MNDKQKILEAYEEMLLEKKVKRPQEFAPLADLWKYIGQLEKEIKDLKKRAK